MCFLCDVGVQPSLVIGEIQKAYHAVYLMRLNEFKALCFYSGNVTGGGTGCSIKDFASLIRVGLNLVLISKQKLFTSL